MSAIEKPYSQASENNKDVILEALQSILSADANVLEVGSGTGQHAVYFCEKMPFWRWQTSDQAAYHAGINLWLAEAALNNVCAPIQLDVCDCNWSWRQYDAVFTANSLHIMPLRAAQQFLREVSAALLPDGLFVAYGPFNYKGAYTSESNARFDQWLKQQHPLSAIRDFEALNSEAEMGGLQLLHDFTMPANNRLLVWKRVLDARPALA